MSTSRIYDKLAGAGGGAVPAVAAYLELVREFGVTPTQWRAILIATDINADADSGISADDFDLLCEEACSSIGDNNHRY